MPTSGQRQPGCQYAWAVAHNVRHVPCPPGARRPAHTPTRGHTHARAYASACARANTAVRLPHTHAYPRGGRQPRRAGGWGGGGRKTSRTRAAHGALVHEDLVGVPGNMTLLPSISPRMHPIDQMSMALVYLPSIPRHVRVSVAPTCRCVWPPSRFRWPRRTYVWRSYRNQETENDPPRLIV